MNRILVVDDDPHIIKTLERNLRARGYKVDAVSSGEEALVVAARRHPDVVILDLGLPAMDGFDVVAGLRGWLPVPIIILSARDAEPAKVRALDLGADDYLTKPFGMDELLARVRAALRRAVVPEGKPVVEAGTITIDFTAKEVSRAGAPVRLTPTQWHIVEVLVRNVGRLVTHEQLLHEVWGPEFGSETNYLRVFMAQIRKKLEDDPAHPRHFITVSGIGFRFQTDDTDESDAPDDASGGSAEPA